LERRRPHSSDVDSTLERKGEDDEEEDPIENRDHEYPEDQPEVKPVVKDEVKDDLVKPVVPRDDEDEVPMHKPVESKPVVDEAHDTESEGNRTKDHAKDNKKVKEEVKDLEGMEEKAKKHHDASAVFITKWLEKQIETLEDENQKTEKSVENLKGEAHGALKEFHSEFSKITDDHYNDPAAHRPHHEGSWEESSAKFEQELAEEDKGQEAAVGNLLAQHDEITQYFATRPIQVANTGVDDKRLGKLEAEYNRPVNSRPPPSALPGVSTPLM
jgi:hypothetical protein